VLAAGASVRMGRPKLNLPLNNTGETFLSRIVATMLQAGVRDVVVVTGAETRLSNATSFIDGRIRIIENPCWRDGQLTSLLAGLNAPADAPLDAAVVALVDVPFVSADTVVRLIAEWRTARAPVVRPARGDEHGHPVIFDSVLFPELRRADPSVGAKSVVRAHEREILNVPIADPGAYLDVDTPEEYERLLTNR